MATLTAIFQAQDNLSNAMTKAGNAGSKATGIMQKLGKIGSVAMKGIVTAVTAAGTALVALGKKAVSVGMNFETSMSQVMATMGIDKSTEEGQAAYDKLSAAAQKMGAETAFTASQSADALNYLALAGYDADKAVAALPTVLHLAGAGGMELSAASDMITDSMAALQMEVNQTNLDRFADQMAKTASTTNTSVSQLGEAILTVGATAANLRNGTTELNTQLGILANVGIKGAEGGTHLRNILLRLQSPTTKAAKQLQKLGVSVYDTDGKMRDTGAIFEDLKNSMEGMDQSQIDQIMSTIFNKTDIAAANALLAGSGDEYARLFNIIENSGGAAAKMYETMLDNLNGDVDIFKSSVEALYLSLFNSTSGTLRELVQTGTGYVQRLNDAFKAGGFEGLVTELGNVLGDAVGVIMSYVPSIIQAGTGIVIAFVESIGNNADVIADAVAEVGVKLIDAIIKIAPKLAGAFGKLLGSAAISLVEAIPGLFKAVPDKLYSALGLDRKNVLSVVQRFGRNMGAALSKIFKGDFKGAVTNISTALGLDKASIANIQRVIGRLGTSFKRFGQFVETTFTDAKKAFQKGFAEGGFFGGVSAAFDSVKTSLSKIDWSGIWDSIKTTGTELWGKLKGAVTSAKDKVVAWFQSVDWGDVWSNVKTTASDLWNKLKAAVSGAALRVSGWFQSVNWGDVWANIKTTATSLWEKLKAAVSGAALRVSGWFKSVNWGDVWASVKVTAADLWDKMKTAVSGAALRVRGWFSTVNWGDVWASIKITASDLWEKLKAAVSGAALRVRGWFQSVDWGDVWANIKATAGDLWSKLSGAVSGLGLRIRGWFAQFDWSAIWDGISSTGSMLWNNVKSAIESASGQDGIVGTLATALSDAMTTAENIKSGVSEAVKILSSNGTVGTIWTSVESIAQSILNIVKQCVTSLTGDAADASSETSNGIVSVVEAISKAAEVMAKVLDAVSTAITSLNDAGMLAPILEGIGGAIAAYFTASAVMNVVNFFKAFAAGKVIMGALSPEIAVLAASVGALVALISWAHDKVKLEDKTVGSYKEQLVTELLVTLDNPTITNESQAMQAINEQINGMVESGAIGADVGAKLSEIFNEHMMPDGTLNEETFRATGYNAAIELVNGVQEGMASGTDIQNPTEDLMASVTQTMEQVTGQTIDFTGMYGGMDAAANQAASDALTTLNGIADQLNTSGFDTAGSEAGQGYANGLQGADTTGAASAMVTATENAVRAAQQSGSPAAAFMPMGAEAAQGYGMGLQQEDVSSYASAFIETIGAALTASASTITLLPEGVNIMRTLLQGMNSMRGAILSGARATGTGIRSAFASVNLTSIGSNIMRGLQNGMNSAFSSLLARARQMAAQLKQTLKEGMEVNSPSKFTTWLGEMTGQGMANGFEVSTKNAMNAAESMVDSVRSAFAPMEISTPTVPTPSGAGDGIITPNAATLSPYQALGSEGQGSGTSERHVTIDINGSGRISVNGVSKDQVLDLLVENLRPVLMDLLEEETFEGGDGVYEF